MGYFSCSDCGRQVSVPEGEDPKRSTCFKCHVGSISIGFTYGKENFHGDTIKQRQDQAIRDAASEGRTIEPVGQRWV